MIVPSPWSPTAACSVGNGPDRSTRAAAGILAAAGRRVAAAADGRLLGIWYELDRPFVYYTDERARSLVEAVSKFEPGKFSHISDYTPDGKIDRVTLLTEIEKFLRENLGPGVTTGS